MGYPNFGIVKTVVIPSLIELLDADGITLDEYQKRFGIDLKNFIEIVSENDGEARFNFGKNAVVYVTADNSTYSNDLVSKRLFSPNVDIVNVSEATTHLILAWKNGDETIYNGIVVLIPRDNFDLEHATVQPYII